jgi:hypothetical protein
MSASQFRATTPDEGPAIADFLQRVFEMPADSPVIDQRSMEWKYWIPHPGWNGSRSYVMERDGVIIAHGAVVPLACRWGDRSLKIVHVIDWAARSDSQGAGMSMMTRLGKLADGVFAAGGSEMTEKILPAFGFKESCKAAPFVRPLRPLRVLQNEPNKSWKSLARYGRRMTWIAQAAMSSSRKRFASRLLSAEELGRTALPFPRPTAQASSVFERSAEELQWFLKCPLAPVELYAVESKGKAIGYFLLTFPLSQARIADAWVDSDQTDDWVALYAAAVQRCAEKPQAAEVATVATTAVAIEALQQCGFQRRGEIALRFLLRGGPPPDIRYQLLDGEAAFWHDGKESFWS